MGTDNQPVLREIERNGAKRLWVGNARALPVRWMAQLLRDQRLPIELDLESRPCVGGTDELVIGTARADTRTEFPHFSDEGLLFMKTVYQLTKIKGRNIVDPELLLGDLLNPSMPLDPAYQQPEYVGYKGLPRGSAIKPLFERLKDVIAII